MIAACVINFYNTTGEGKLAHEDNKTVNRETSLLFRIFMMLMLLTYSCIKSCHIFVKTPFREKKEDLNRVTENKE